MIDAVRVRLQRRLRPVPANSLSKIPVIRMAGEASTPITAPGFALACNARTASATMSKSGTSTALRIALAKWCAVLQGIASASAP